MALVRLARPSDVGHVGVARPMGVRFDTRTGQWDLRLHSFISIDGRSTWLHLKGTNSSTNSIPGEYSIPKLPYITVNNGKTKFNLLSLFEGHFKQKFLKIKYLSFRFCRMVNEFCNLVL